MSKTDEYTIHINGKDMSWKKFKNSKEFKQIQEEVASV